MRTSWSDEEEDNLVRVYEGLLTEHNCKTAFAMTSNIIGRTYSATRLRYYKVKNAVDKEPVNEENVEAPISIMEVFKQFAEKMVSVIEITIRENSELKDTIQSLLLENGTMHKEIETVLRYMKIASTQNTLQEIGMTISDKPRYIMQSNGNLERG